MKLIDLLVKELPNRGGWPDGADFSIQKDNCVIDFIGLVKSSSCRGETWTSEIIKCLMTDDLGDDYLNNFITKGEYEKALPKAIGKMIPADGNANPEFEFISIISDALNGNPIYRGRKKDNSEYECFGKYWIPEMYEQKSDKEVVEDAIKEDMKNILDSSAKLVVAKLVEKAISQVEDAGCNLISGGIATKPDCGKKSFNPLNQYFVPDNVNCRCAVTNIGEHDCLTLTIASSGAAKLKTERFNVDMTPNGATAIYLPEEYTVKDASDALESVEHVKSLVKIIKSKGQ